MREGTELFTKLYEKLRQLAKVKLNQEYGSNASRDATSLLHDSYLKLRIWAREFESEEHFLAITASVMRQVLVDRVRTRRSLKRSAEEEPLSIWLENLEDNGKTIVDLLQFDELLVRLGSFDARAAEIVEMRVFLGLSEQEIAKDLGVAPRTVRRDWSAALAWLKVELEPSRRRPRRDTPS